MITSSTNSRIKQIVKYGTKARARKEADVFLVEGLRMFREIPRESLLETYVTEEFITVKSGLLRQKEDDCYMYKIVDTRLVRSLAERIFGLGTVECFGGDATDPVLHLKHIRHSKEIKNFILAASEEQRARKRTLQTQNIGSRGPAPVDLDGDGIPDLPPGHSCDCEH